ncbi:SDR family NAD(P)-dependent oxidoreductase [Rhodobacteraceae bacterium 2CG4]|uniref:SDR family NAD(P)-dependent oxidoreductase n=1 Tax=Halovulum marinum TaxID=2662447 RepID=A0A6L5YXZ8_9RHOB|nr:SDR family oxidoreductase [Halovulum marinum]MSU89191.1 SDR family NAD(P)-dependent oxidoreductase [Halovulum marinum]
MTTKTLLLTGASSGIGAATARAAVEAGWAVGLFARSADKLQTLADELGDAALPLPGDVADPEAQAGAVAALVARFGRLDAAFANAGIGAGAPGTEGGDLDSWRQMLDVNLWGALVTARTTLPELRKTRGHFLVTGSRAGRSVIKGSVYGATKWFIHGWAANLLEEMREWGGRCTVVAPGMVDTEFFDEKKPKALRPEDVARGVVWALQQPASVNVGEVYLMPNPEAG